jgi:hypothetical protein
LIAVFTFSMADDLIARGRSGGGFSRSSSRSSRSSSSRKSGGYGSKRAAPKPKSPAQIKATKAASAKRAQNAKIANEKKAAAKKVKAQKKAVATKDKTAAKKDAKTFKNMDTKSPKYAKADKELQSTIGKSGKTFKTRSSAKTDMTKKMANKKYDYKDSKTAMASRPSYVPTAYTRGGVNYPTSYMGGSYGYYNPLHPAIFIPYMATSMMINDSMLHSHGYRPYVRPAYHPMSPFGATLIILLICGIIGTGVYVSNKNA